MPILEQDAPEIEKTDNEKKSLFRQAKDWFSERFANLRKTLSKAIEAIRERIPTLGREGRLLSRLETRVLGGRDAYNKIYSVVSKEEADRAVFEKENLPSTISAELNKPETTIGINNGERLLIEDKDLQKRYIANAYTIGSDGLAGSSACYIIKSTDDLSSMRVSGREAAHGSKELENVSENTRAFKTMVNKFRANIADGKEVEEIMPNKPFVNKESGIKITNGSFDVGQETIMKVTITEKANGSVNLSIYNVTDKSSIEIKNATSFESAVEQASELINASEKTISELSKVYAEREGKELTEDNKEAVINIDSLDIGDIVETQNGRLYVIKDAVDISENERIFTGEPIVYNEESGRYERGNANGAVEISSDDIKDIHKDIELEDDKETLSPENEKDDKAPTYDETSERNDEEVVVEPAKEDITTGVNPQQNDIESEAVPSEQAQDDKETLPENIQKEETLEDVRPVDVPVTPEEEKSEKLPEKQMPLKNEQEKSADVSEGISVNDIVSKGGHDYRVTKIDEVRNSFYVKPVRYDETKNHWVSIGNKADAVALERSDEYDIKEKAPKYTPQKNDIVITDDGKVGTYVARNKVNINGEIYNCKSELLQQYNPPEKTETISTKDILGFEAGGEEKAPSLDDVQQFPQRNEEDIEIIENDRDELEMSADF